MSVINPIWFYIADVTSKLLGALAIAMTLLIFLLVALIVVTFTIYDDCDLEEQKVLKKVIKMTTIGIIVSGSLYVVIPNDKTIYKMLIAKNVTYENLDKASEVIKDSVDYIFDKVNSKEGESND